MSKLIPKPKIVISKSKYFVIDRDTFIKSDKELNSLVIFFTTAIKKEYNLDLKVNDSERKKKKKNCIVFQLKELKDVSYEAYKLNIRNYGIELTATTKNGIFYGIQTIMQLIYHDNPNYDLNERFLKINCVEIRDNPRFQWRGFMLDEARHFFGKEIVKNILDIMAFLKFNIFHWHLTDDQGWRIEIEKYPRLMEVGSRRRGTNVSKHKVFVHSNTQNVETDGIPVVGYYTKEDIKEIITYAAERYITIIPEFDIPGHTTALLAAYPELSCTGGPFEVGTRFGIYKDVLCIGKEITFKYIEEILSEVIELFPSDFIHIGGDEVPKTRWKRCPDCQTRMEGENIETLNTLQLYFSNRIGNFLLGRGKKVICWNDTVEKGLNKKIYCQYWNAHFEKIIKEVREGRKVIISEINPNYLNYPYKLNSLEHTYQYEPIPKELSETYHENVIGIEACLWTEYIKTQEKLEWQIFPRLLAIAEIGWTQNNKRSYVEFEIRLANFLKLFKKQGINCAQKEEYEGKDTEIANNYLKSV